MSEALDIIAFGPFQIDTNRRQLSRAGAAIPLSSRAFDILVLLVDNRSRVVTKDQIMRVVWRGMIVEENNLAVQISALRRALSLGVGEAPVILTIPGQGYRFVGALGAEPARPLAVAVPPENAEQDRATSLPAPPGVMAAVSAPASSRLWRSPAVMAALCVCVTALAGFVMLRPAAPPPSRMTAMAAPRLSIAVLPFRDLSDDRCCDYLADAISDDLTTDLSLIPGSVVIARESADVFRGHATPAGAIGRALNVRYLLEGSLRSVDGVFSINAQLIDAASGGHLWAERFAVPRAHLADAQAAIVQRLASALGVRLVDIEGARSLAERPENPDALDLFLRARSVLDRSDSLESMNQAQALLEQARVLAPDDIKVLSELGWLLPRRAHDYVTVNQASEIAEARQLTARAQALSPADPAVLAALGALQAFDGDYAGARTIFQSALNGEPSSVRALSGLTFCKLQLGQFADAANSLDALMRIDPESSKARMRAYQMGMAEIMLDRPGAAIAWLRRAIAGDADPLIGAPDLGIAEWTRAYLVAALRMTGDRDASDALFAAYRKMWPARDRWSLEARSPRGFSAVPGFQHFLAALDDAGMRRFTDQAPGADSGACDTADLQPTPHAVRGVLSADTQAVAAMLKDAGTAIVDFGVGAAVPAGAQLLSLDASLPADIAVLHANAAIAHASTIVFMGSGPLDPRGCRAAGLFAQAGTRVLWYRGGESAWAEAGLPFRDMR